jgi:hypothetical protein
LTADVFHAVGQFFAEDFSSFDKLVFKRKKQNARQTFLRGLTAWFFISADNFGAEHLSYFDSFDFRRKNKPLGGQFIWA